MKIRLIIFLLFVICSLRCALCDLALDTATYTNCTRTNVTINGSLTGTNGTTNAVNIILYWGQTDGSTNATSWIYAITNSYTSPALPLALSTNLYNLYPSTRYYFRWYASEGTGSLWSSYATNCLTLAGVPTNDAPTVPYTPVATDSNGVLATPTNFFIANTAAGSNGGFMVESQYATGLGSGNGNKVDYAMYADAWSHLTASTGQTNGQILFMSDYLTGAMGWMSLGTAATSPVSAFATAAQGALADTALQSLAPLTVSTNYSTNYVIITTNIIISGLTGDLENHNGIYEYFSETSYVLPAIAYIENLGDAWHLKDTGLTDLTGGSVSNNPISANYSDGSYTGVPAWTNSYSTNVVTNIFVVGNGGGLTNLNADNISSGTVALARLPSLVVTNGGTNLTLAGTFSGNGAGMTDLSNSVSYLNDNFATNQFSSGVNLYGTIQQNPVWTNTFNVTNSGIAIGCKRIKVSGIILTAVGSQTNIFGLSWKTNSSGQVAVGAITAKSFFGTTAVPFYGEIPVNENGEYYYYCSTNTTVSYAITGAEF